ncbi:MAG: hypothetical protein WC806_02025 [Candidatus Gracilibacteria bacterium]|jgi:hypothetical protein
MAEENKIKTAEKGGLSDYQKMQIRKLGLSEDNFNMSKVGDKALGFDLIEKLYNSDNQKLCKGDFEKHDKHDPYNLFLEALKNGMFPNGGKHADKFLLALEGGKNQKAAVVEILEKNSGSQISSAKFAKCLKQLEEAEQKDAQVNPIEASTDIFSRISSITETADSSADTKERISGEVNLEEEKIQREIPAFGAWELDLLPESLIKSFNSKVENFNKLSVVYFEEIKNAIPFGDELNELELEKISLTSKIENPSLDAKESAELTKELESLEIKIFKLKAEVSKRENEIFRLGNRLETAKFEMKKEEEEVKDYLLKKLDELWKFNFFARTSGVSMGGGADLKKWMIDQDSSDSNGLGGVKAGPDGKAEKVYGNIKIKRVFFAETEKSRKDSSGSLMIEYEEDGQTIFSNARNFYDKLNALEVHDNITDIDELNFEVAPNCNFKDIEKGDKFSVETLSKVTDDGEQYEHEEFVIESIDLKDKTITLDRPVLTLKRQFLGIAVPNTLYFDRTAKTLPFGAFKKLILQRKFERVKTSADTISRIAQASLDYSQKVSERMNKVFKKAPSKSSSKKLTVTLPKPGEKKKMNFHDDKTGKKRLVDVENLGPDPEGKDQYDIIIDRTEGKSPFGDEQKKLRKLHAMGIVKEDPETDLPKVPVKPKIERRRLVASTPKRPMFELSNPNRAHSDVQVQQGALTDPLNDSNDDMAVLEEMNNTPVTSVAPTAHTPAHEEPTPPSAPTNIPEIYKKEALPYDEVHKVAGNNNIKFDIEQRSYLENLWQNTHLLCCSDIFELGKAAWEYHHRKWERTQKERFSVVGKELPYIDREMARINNSVEGEEVETFKHAMAEKGVDEILLIMRETKNQDEFKACLMDLASRGQIRWDDIGMWKNMNRFLKHQYVIPLPANGDPYTLVSGKQGAKTGLDFLQPAVDSLWGENTYNQLYSQNVSSFTSKAKGWYEKGSELENVPGGHDDYLTKLLDRHKKGDGFVDPQEYEGLILHAIENGKSNMPAKFYFMVEGLTAKHPHTGRTILSWDRLAHINSALLPKFPILEYMTKTVMRKDGKAHMFTKDDYEEWAKLFDGDNHYNCKPTAAVSKFLWEYVIPSDETQNRTNKAIRHPENLDHDDMYAYLPITTEQVIEDACGNISGNKKGFTVEGYCNAFPGFSEYMKSMSNSGNKNKLREAIKSYVKFQGIMTSRYKKERENQLQRLDKATLNSASIVSDQPTITFMNELNSVVKQIVAHYNDDILNGYADKIFNWEVGSIKTDPAELKKQRLIDDAFAAFGDRLSLVVKRDEGAAMTDIIKNAHLIGMTDSYVSSEEMDKKKEEIQRRKGAIQSEYNLH